MPIGRSREGAVEILTLNRPEARNAINGDQASSLNAALDELAGDETCRVVVLTGRGEVFCSGVDLKMQVEEGIDDVLFPGTGFAGLTQREFPKPLICAANGSAYGGGFELALACDLIVAPTDAEFGFSEASLGLIPDAGGLIRVPNRIPLALALEMFFTADPVSAGRAAEIGLINRAVAREEVLEVALGLAERIVRCSPVSIELIKKLAYRALSVHEYDTWPLNDVFMEAIMSSRDFEEGPLAWVEDRAPDYWGT